jgi:hypothetical protein
MTEPKFTRGPWTAEGDEVTAADGLNGDYRIADTFGPDFKANARLTAAAPEMFEVVRSFIAHYPVGTNPYLDGAYNLGRRALAKSLNTSSEKDAV